MKGIRSAVMLGLAVAVLAAALVSAGESGTLKIDEKLLDKVQLKSDADSLLAFFKGRTLNDGEILQVEALIHQLGANSFAKREQASAKLVGRGPVIVPMLKKYFDHKDLEIAERSKKAVQQIQEKNVFTTEILGAAVRMLGERKPAAAAEVLLNYLPFADNDTVAEEVRTTLGVVALRDGKADPVLVKGLVEKNPILRSGAGEALALARDKEHAPAVWKLLDDPELLVKYRVALGLTLAEEPKAVPVLIGLLPALDQSQAWQVEDMLIRLAQGNDPPKAALGQSKESKENCSKEWMKWWQKHSATVNLARLKTSPKLLGYTLIVLLEAGQIMELGNNNEVRWQLNNLNFPLDVQLLPGDRVLIAEYHGGKVTERDMQGNIQWQYPIFGPLAAQRLDNGNTFIVTDEELVEVDKNKNKVFTHFFGKGERVMKGTKLSDGRIVCLTNGQRILVLDEKGKELKNFNVVQGKHLFGGRLYMTPTNRVLVPHNFENKVIEYDLEGNNIWELKVQQPVSAVRLPNGNTLVTTMDMPGKVFEYDRGGNEVWSYATKTNTKITRALRR